jgi:uncharacterized protein (DUF983 family)
VNEPDPPLPPDLCCPHCQESDPRFFDVWKTLFYCQVCGKTWARTVEKDVNGVVIDGE